MSTSNIELSWLRSDMNLNYKYWCLQSFSTRVLRIDGKNLSTRKFIKRLVEKFNHKGSVYDLRYNIIKKKRDGQKSLNTEF